MFSSEFPFEPRFISVRGSKMHYVDEGSGRPFLFLHGNPTWSYLWRNIIPTIKKHARCVAVDLIGFGKSEKPDIDYRFETHYKYLERFIDKLGLKDVALVSHDWGGVLGFYYALNHPENVKGIAFMETAPFTVSWDSLSAQNRWIFKLLRTALVGKFMVMNMNVFLNKIMPENTDREIPRETLRRYQEPFPTPKSRYPIYVWPNEIAFEGDETKTYKIVKQIETSLPNFKCPMLLLRAIPGAVIGDEKTDWLKRQIKDLTVQMLGSGRHFVQEENPEGIAKFIVGWAHEKHLFH